MRYRFVVSLLLIATLLGSVWPVGHSSSLSLADAPDTGWAQPQQPFLHKVGALTAQEAERAYNCTWLTYRFRGDLSKSMQSGCFVQAAFGMVDPEQSVLIATGTDEAEPIRYGGQPAALSILPYSGNVGRFGGFPGLGSYLYLYTNFPGTLAEQGSPLQPYKEVTSLPNFLLRDSSGAALPVNPLAFAYAARSQWLVTESPAHALVRINLADYSILPFDYSFYVAGNPYAEHRASLAITEDGRYAAVASAENHNFKIYDLKHCAPNPILEEPSLQHCDAYDYWPTVTNQLGTLQNITQITFVQDGLLSFTALSGGTSTRYLLSPNGEIGSLIPYLGIGDSYASGQGAFDYLSGTDTASNQCHVSVHSYPLLLSGDLFGSAGHSVACSGAKIHDLADMSPTYHGQSTDTSQSRASVLSGFKPGIVAQQTFVTEYLPGVLTVQIGGNDIGFGDLMLRCISPVAHIRPFQTNPNNCFESYEDRLELEQLIDRTYVRWVQTYRQLQAASPGSRVYAIGYPDIVSPTAKCRLNAPFTKEDIAFALDASHYLNSVMKKAATAAGVQFIDISDALKGHELCSGALGELAMNGITAGTDTFHVLGQESFHPNAFGHQLIEQAILNATHHFANNEKPIAEPNLPVPQPHDSDPLLQASKTGRTVARSTPVTGMVMPGSRGGTLHIALTDIQNTYLPNSVVTVIIGDSKAGTITVGSNGNVSGDIAVPPTISAGPQPVTVAGTNPEGQPTSSTEVTYVQDQPNDYDGDGILNPVDPCPGTVTCETTQTQEDYRQTVITESPKQPAGTRVSPIQVQTDDHRLQDVKAASTAGKTAPVTKRYTPVQLVGNLPRISWWLWILLILIIVVLRFVLGVKNKKRPMAVHKQK